jgi:hypothetical protein
MVMPADRKTRGIIAGGDANEISAFLQNILESSTEY